MSRVMKSSFSYGHNQNKNKNAPSSKTPYCGTCHKAGLPVEEYTNHWTKSSPDASGVVVCPLILNSECSYCHERGHFKTYCPILKDRKKNETIRCRGGTTTAGLVAKQLSSLSSVAPPNLVANRFADLDSDSDCEAGEAGEADDVVVATTFSNGPSYASVLLSKRLPEVSKRLPEVSNRLPEVSNRLPEVSNRLPEVSKRLPEVSKRLPEVTVDDGVATKMRRLNVSEVFANHARATTMEPVHVVETKQPRVFVKSSRPVKRFWADYDDDDEDDGPTASTPATATATASAYSCSDAW